MTRISRPRSALPAIPRTVPWGIALAAGTALISGVAVYLNAFGVRQLPDAAVYTTLKNAVAAAVLLVVAVRAGAVAEAAQLDRRRWAAVAAIGVVGGSIPFVLFFTGMAQASAPSAAFIHKTLFVWVALLAVPFLGERLGLASLAALGLLLAGQALVMPPTGIAWGGGETLILVATLLWAVETTVAKRLLGSVSSQLLGALRMTLGLVILVAYLAVTGKLSVVAGLSAVQWGWAILTGTLLAGYVATWFAALQRAPASVVTAVLVGGAVVTGALNALAAGSMPVPATVAGHGLIATAAIALAWLAVRVARAPAPGAPAAARVATDAAAR
jgi:drug/metabolite transporter (DMT)-like permease